MKLSYSTWGMPQVPIDVAMAHCDGSRVRRVGDDRHPRLVHRRGDPRCG